MRICKIRERLDRQTHETQLSAEKGYVCDRGKLPWNEITNYQT